MFGSIPAAMPATQMLILIVLAVLTAMLYTNPGMLTAALIAAKKGSFMMTTFGSALFQPTAQTLNAIWCSCIAAGAVPRPI